MTVTQALSRTPSQTVTACQCLRPAGGASNLAMTNLMRTAGAATRILRSLKHEVRELGKALTMIPYIYENLEQIYTYPINV